MCVAPLPLDEEGDGRLFSQVSEDVWTAMSLFRDEI